MRKVLVDPTALEEAAKWLEVHSSGPFSAEAFAADALREVIAQPAEVEALMKWKQTAEYWYGQYRSVKHGESPAEYPTEGKLDDWHNSYHNT